MHGFFIFLPCQSMNCNSNKPLSTIQARSTCSGVVLSDLHLHTRRTSFASLDQAVRTIDLKFDHLVLNGDIFDFRWNVINDAKSAVDSAVEDIINLLEKWPELSIHYVIGNHDNHLAFIEALREPAIKYNRFSYYGYYLQLGRHFFLHGDCCNTKTVHHLLETRRKRWAQQKRRPHYQATLYALLERLGVSIIFNSIFFPRQRIAARILYYLQTIPDGFPEGVRDIYLGHSHLPFQNFEYKGYRFHNSGSGVSPMRFKPVRFDW